MPYSVKMKLQENNVFIENLRRLDEAKQKTRNAENYVVAVKDIDKVETELQGILSKQIKAIYQDFLKTNNEWNTIKQLDQRLREASKKYKISEVNSETFVRSEYSDKVADATYDLLEYQKRLVCAYLEYDAETYKKDESIENIEKYIKEEIKKIKDPNYQEDDNSNWRY